MDSFHNAENYIIKAEQQEIYGEEIACLRSTQPLPRNSSIPALNPYLDDKKNIWISRRIQAKIQKDKSVHPISRKEHRIGPVPNELIHVAGTQYKVVKQRTFVEIELKRYL